MGLTKLTSPWTCHRELPFCTGDLKDTRQPESLPSLCGLMDKQVVKPPSCDSAWTCPTGYSQQAGAVWLSSERTLCLTNTSPVKALTGCQAQTVNSGHWGVMNDWTGVPKLYASPACYSCLMTPGAPVRMKECARGWGALLSLQGKLGLAFEVSIMQSWVQSPGSAAECLCDPGNLSLPSVSMNFQLLKKKKKKPPTLKSSHLVIKYAKFLPKV